MRDSEVIRKFIKTRAKLLCPISDDQQKRLDESIDADLNKCMDMDPQDPRAIRNLRGALWLWS